MIYWAQLFHFYQPATQLPSVLEKICNESYRPLLEVFREYPQAKATVNINAVLTEMLKYCGHNDVIQGLKELAEKGQIEITGTGKYHPILPLIPPDEAKRQIELNQKTNAYFFGSAYKPSGFFPPEMAYSRDIIKPVMDTGHRWIILSGVACPADWPLDTIYQVELDGKRLAVFFRDDLLSNKISFQEIGSKDFLEHLKGLGGEKENIYIVTAMDAETYGHHIKDWEELFLAEVYEELQVRSDTYAHLQQKKVLAAQHTSLLRATEAAEQVRAVTITQLIDLFQPGQVIDPKTSSWSTTGEDIQADNPFPLWRDKDSELHRLQWEHTAICTELRSASGRVADNGQSKHSAGIARGLLDRALQSDQFWWASRRPMWDINLVHMGLIDQSRAIINAYRAISISGADDKTKSDCYARLSSARELQSRIVDLLFMP
jgi:alpha-amylase/alpha-mannosidase (GH57 family)